MSKNKGNTELQQQHLAQLIEELKDSPIAVHAADANEQHYEVPFGFTGIVLSRASPNAAVVTWNTEFAELDTAKRRYAGADDLSTCRAAGQQVLELGCSWELAVIVHGRKVPFGHFTVVPIPYTKEYIDEQAALHELTNIVYHHC